MIDQELARLRSHRRNIRRYRNLSNQPQELNSAVKKRLIEEQSNLDSLVTSLPQ